MRTLSGIKGSRTRFNQRIGFLSHHIICQHLRRRLSECKRGAWATLVAGNMLRTRTCVFFYDVLLRKTTFTIGRRCPMQCNAELCWICYLRMLCAKCMVCKYTFVLDRRPPNGVQFTDVSNCCSERISYGLLEFYILFKRDERSGCLRWAPQKIYCCKYGFLCRKNNSEMSNALTTLSNHLNISSTALPNKSLICEWALLLTNYLFQLII